MKRHLFATLAAVQSVSPIGAGTIFAAAYLASYLGFAALLIVAAFLVGLHFAKRPAVETTSKVETASISTSQPAELLPALPSSSPLADALASGLSIRKIEFATPSNGRAKVKTV